MAVNTGGTTAWSTFDPHGNFAGATASGSGTIVNAVRYDAYDAYGATSIRIPAPEPASLLAGIKSPTKVRLPYPAIGVVA